MLLRAFDELLAEDTGLGISRSSRLVFPSMTKPLQSGSAKPEVYRRLRVQIEPRCNMSCGHVAALIKASVDVDRSFGSDRARFVTKNIRGSSTSCIGLLPAATEAEQPASHTGGSLAMRQRQRTDSRELSLPAAAR